MSLTAALASVPSWLISPVADLIRAIVSAPNPREAVERAQRAIVADAADAATDAALGEALKARK